MLRLFVYGTLMRGGPRHHLLAGQRFLGPARTAAHWALHDLGAYPGLVRRAQDGLVIAGELYEIDPSLVPALDQAEGAPALYRLEELDLVDIPGPVFAYVYQRDVAQQPLVPGSRWRNGEA